MAILPPGFISDRSGNFGIMTALLMVPLIGMAGMAVDFAHAMSLRTQLFAAADAAAVGSIAEKSGAVAAAMTMSGNGTISLGKTDARSIFLSQVSGELSDVNVDLGIDVTKTANKLNSQVSFTAVVPTTFMRVLGKDSRCPGPACPRAVVMHESLEQWPSKIATCRFTAVYRV